MKSDKRVTWKPEKQVEVWIASKKLHVNGLEIHATYKHASLYLPLFNVPYLHLRAYNHLPEKFIFHNI